MLDIRGPLILFATLALGFVDHTRLVICIGAFLQESLHKIENKQFLVLERQYIMIPKTIEPCRPRSLCFKVDEKSSVGQERCHAMHCEYHKKA